MNKSFFVLLSLIFFLVQIQAQGQSQNSLRRQIVVTGNGEVKVEPTQATLTVGISLQDPNLTNLTNQAQTTAANIITALQDNGVNASDIQSSVVNVQPFYPTNATTGQPLNTPDYYTATQSFTFVLKNLSNYDTLINQLYDAGVNTVFGIVFGVADRARFEDEARTRAVDDARRIANNLARGLGVNVGRVFSITDQTNTFVPLPISASEAVQTDSTGQLSIAGGQITISASVLVVWNI